MENQEGFENPWTVGSLEHFLYYCCPECHHLKFTSQKIFLQHAIKSHPLAQKCLQMLTGGKEEEIWKEDKGDITKESEKDHIDIEVLSVDDGETYTISEKNTFPEIFRDKKEENNLLHPLKSDADEENEISAFELNPHYIDYDLLIEEDTDSENDSGTNSSGHEKKSLLPCDSCDKTFAYKQHLQKHVKVVHQGIRYKCNYCENKAYSNERRLKNHIKIIHEIHACDECGKRFTAVESLRNHKIMMHIEEKLGQCDMCDKSFNDAYRLKYHKLQIHEGRTFDCTLCENSFRHKYLLQEHIKAIHEGVKFKCLTCCKEFNRKQTLKSHVRYVHTMQRNFSCENCPYKAAQSTDLKKHVERIHKNNTANRNYSFLWKKTKE